ncbi:NAD(P)/FAD-dependent oxidoreductase [Rhodococcus sp. MEB032]|uniref:phytoene desaturase family protein n=1 Tax=Rhodococcus sp. MEB032 TaxID=3040322 RepID=UPI00255039AD|nr:NAD(P)/FAD-dependent oxidoreductase [Rhodococcus sp. MEB032]
MTVPTTDVVVIGSGPNALVAAAYLARGGLSTTVLEASSTPGGGTSSDEHLLPGYVHDLASSLHPLIQFNPVIAADELGLMSEHGLRYVAPDPAMGVVTEDGSVVALYQNVADTAAEIAQYSQHDADAFVKLTEDWGTVLPLFIKRMASPPDATLEADPEVARKLANFIAPSAAQAVQDAFEDERTRALMLNAGAHDSPNPPGTGFLPMHWAGMLSTVSWPHAVGGTGALAKSLISSIEAHGGSIHCGQRVERIVVEDGRAVGVTTASGERFDAKQAVVSSAYVGRLQEMLGETSLPPEFERLREWKLGAAVFVVHLILKQVPTFRTSRGDAGLAVAGFGTAPGIAAQREEIAEGRLSGSDRWMMAMCPSVVDSTRAPSGHATLKLLTVVPYRLNGDPDNWAREKEAYADELVEKYAAAVNGYAPGEEIARSVYSPVDLERMNLNFVEGEFLGGELTPDQAGANRPVPGWSSYRMPVPGLYLTGAGTFPGGGVSGWPGRNAARAVFDDLGIDTKEFMGEAGEPDTLPSSFDRLRA